MKKYSVMLDDLIHQSGMSLTEVSNKCKELGVNVTVSYLSKLRNGKMPPPSYKITVVLAKTLGVEPEKLLAAGRNEESENEKQELIEALETVYPDLEYGEIYEKMMEIYVAYHQILEPIEGLTLEEEEEVNEWYRAEQKQQEIDLEKLLEGKSLKWDDEILSEDKRRRAIEMLKLLFNTKKDT